ncbi:phytanoyl-CoA dioxygenase family protein [Azospirillum sp. B21]|uniref:phytanoyl-CoA dioxygenase family protein n=1 Tax=Azospirillum sp. B21 TaxID=2607496 RepID=UPI0011EE5F01|nr:phytanoyl-CoA dioxygenase family protein [Azospirillum sp. B21]KAA0577875.1 phytanoyl-CoA dioxygenase family protein [Azospirillum sp. B21]
MPTMCFQDDRPLSVAQFYSAFPSPWGGLQTYARFKVGELSPALKEAFCQYGIVKITDVFEPAEVERCMNVIKALSGLEDSDFPAVAQGTTDSFIFPGGIGHCPDLWPLVSDATVRKALDLLIDEPVCMITNTIGANFSSPGLHRDSVLDRPGTLDHDPGHYLIQVVIHANGPGRPKNSLAFIPFSHQRSIYARKSREAGVVHPADFFLIHHSVKMRALESGDCTELLEMERHIMKVDIDPGDIVLFDTRLIHSGDVLSSPKYMVINKYGPHSFFNDDLLIDVYKNTAPPNDCDFPEPFIEFLRRHDLMAPEAERALMAVDRVVLRNLAMLRPGSPMFIYGAGSAGRSFRVLLAERKLPDVQGFIDTNFSGEVDGLRCYSLSEYKEIHSKAHTILIVSTYGDEIRAGLEAVGIEGALDAFRFVKKKGNPYAF